MSTISEAVAAFEQMAQLGRALQSAGIVLAVLQNAEQVKAELDAAVAAKRAELEQATQELAAARSTADTLLTHAKDIVAQAEAAAQAAHEAAGAAVAETNERGARDAAQAREALAALQTQIDAAQTELVARHADLDKVNADIAAAKHAAKIMLADHA
jgi:chromosome segregation ATPase